MIRKKSYSILLCGFSLFCLASAGQKLIPESKMVIDLSDCTRVILYRAVTTDKVDNACYYLPVNFRISEKSGKPEFSFLSYDSDDDGRNEGAIMHILLTWGMTEAQQAEAEMSLRGKVDSTLFIAGCPLLSGKGEDIRFEIHSANPLGEVLRKSLRSQGSPPWSPGEKMALSFMFSPENSQRMETAFKNPEQLKGIFFDLTFKISVGHDRDTLLLRGDFQKWIKNLP